MKKDREPKYHDFRCGRDYTFDPIDGGLKGSMCGWTRGIQPGDKLIMKGGQTYKVDSISYFRDPSDMFSANVSFVPAYTCSECKQKFESEIKPKFCACCGAGPAKKVS